MSRRVSRLGDSIESDERRKARKLTGDDVVYEESLQVTMVEGLLEREVVVMLLSVVY